MSNFFTCIACGAPVEPEAGRDRMACPYCHTQLTIPDDMRRAPIPIVEAPRVEVNQLPPQETQQQVADFIRQVQPVAIRGWNVFAWWTRLRRFIPGCTIALLAACGILCFLFALLINFIRK